MEQSQSYLVNTLSNLLHESDLDIIKNRISQIYSYLPAAQQPKSFNPPIDRTKSEASFLKSELDQILSTRTLERTRYYINRLRKALTETRLAPLSDINLNRWKQYEDILTDSLWIMDKRDKTGPHSASYWGNFIPQIPNQLMRRFTRKGDWVLDGFLGSGTTLIESRRLGRNGIGIELQSDIADLAKSNIAKQNPNGGIVSEVVCGDSTSVDLSNVLAKHGREQVDHLILHPPYWDIIKFSEDNNDLSNFESMEAFLAAFKKVIDNLSPFLKKDHYMAIIIGDKYSKGNWIPLGFYVMQQAMNAGYSLKSTIVKNYEETKGKMRQKELWRFRALAGGYYIFKHEYIFLLKKDW